jgi:acyl-coenzyme A thioesterase PaaI-like protein
MKSVTPGEQDVPDGFEAFDPSPFLAVVGPVWVSRQHVPPSFGIRIEERHTNTAGTAHGAMLVALADLALGDGIRAIAGSQSSSRHRWVNRGLCDTCTGR